MSTPSIDQMVEAIVAREVKRQVAAVRAEMKNGSVTTGWMTSKEAAAYLGMTVAALDKHAAARTIPFSQDVPHGKRWFKPATLDAWREGVA